MNPHLNQEQNFTTLEELRAYHNERFIRLMYRSILEREIDTVGLHHYLPLLHQNPSLAEILAELRSSPEAQQLPWYGSEHHPTARKTSSSKDLEKKPDLLTIEDLKTISKNIN